jgi:plastocyanin
VVFPSTPTARRTPRRFLLAALAVVATLAACSNSSKVGGDLSAKGGTNTSSCRLGECTTSTAPAVTSTTAKATTTTRAPVTTRPPASSTTTTAKKGPFVIKIQNDGVGYQFEPRLAGVFVGTTVRWTNTDSVPRSVEGDNDEFKSPMIAPGASFDYVATVKGNFNYHDGTRPYAVGTLQVG